MNIKQFLKPDWRKIVVFVILFIIVSFLGLSIETGIGPKSHWWLERGVPLFYVHEGEYELHNAGFYVFNLILDLLIYFVISYLLSCLIVWIYDKVKKKK